MLKAVVGTRYRLTETRNVELTEGTGQVNLVAGTTLIARSAERDWDHGFGSESSGLMTVNVFSVADGPRRGLTVEVITFDWLPDWLVPVAEDLAP